MMHRASKYAAVVIVVSCLVTIVAFLFTSCLHVRPMPPTLTKYSFGGYQIPDTKPPASVNFTVGVVEPAYREKLPNFYSKVLKSFSHSVGSGLDQILVAKGMTTKGPYESLDEMPYPDKKGSNLVLTETVLFQMTEEEKGGAGEAYYSINGRQMLCAVRDGKLTVEAWLNYEMREPLSGEKMWIKKLDLGTFERNYQVGVERVSKSSGDPWTPVVWINGDVVFNTKGDAFAYALGEIYPQIMDKAWTFINTEELLDMMGKIRELRDRLSVPLQ